MYTGFRQTSLLFVIRDSITLKKTNYYNHILKKLSGGKSYAYKLITNNPEAIRNSKVDGNNAIMLAGGPKLVEKQLLPNNEEYRILQIIHKQNDYYIILEEINGTNIFSDNSTENV